MALGPGKYDPEATMVREKTKALGVLVAVIEGDRGNGFSVQAPIAVLVRLAPLLRQMADQIEGTEGLTS